MVSFFAPLVALAILPTALAQQLTINTPPSVVQCQPTQLGWSGGTGPYFLSFIPAGQPSAPAIKQFPTQNGNTFTWTADLASGTTFTISLRDSTGAQAFSDIVTVQSGPDSGCINTAITETGTGGSAAPTSGGTSTPSAPGATTTGASSAASSASSSAASSAASGSAKPTSPSGSAASSSPSPSSAASTTQGNALAMAGMMGLVGAILF